MADDAGLVGVETSTFMLPSGNPSTRKLPRRWCSGKTSASGAGDPGMPPLLTPVDSYL